MRARSKALLGGAWAFKSRESPARDEWKGSGVVGVSEVGKTSSRKWDAVRTLVLAPKVLIFSAALKGTLVVLVEDLSAKIAHPERLASMSVSSLSAHRQSWSPKKVKMAPSFEHEAKVRFPSFKPIGLCIISRCIT